MNIFLKPWWEFGICIFSSRLCAFHPEALLRKTHFKLQHNFARTTTIANPHFDMFASWVVHMSFDILCTFQSCASFGRTLPFLAIFKTKTGKPYMYHYVSPVSPKPGLYHSTHLNATMNFYMVGSWISRNTHVGMAPNPCILVHQNSVPAKPE